MVKQYESYTYPELGNISVNGINTLGENAMWDESKVP